MAFIRSLGRSTGRSRRLIFLVCLCQALLLLAVSFTFQFIIMHNMASVDDILPNASTQLLATRLSDVTKRMTLNLAPRPVIAYMVTLTGCGGGDDKRYSQQDALNLINQGAAVLKHSIHLAHAQTQKYDYQMYAIVHPAAKECSSAMSNLGYTVLIRNTPFDKKDIQQKFLRDNIDKASCCGEKEFIKLYAYTLLQHPVVVILDLDSLVLQPFDSLFDAIIEGDDLSIETREKLPIHDNGNVTFPKKIDAFYTKDYNMINAGYEEYAGVQGGFLMIRPSEKVFDEFIDLVLEGNYIEHQGWGGKYGYFFGGAQVQGIWAYYYAGLHPDVGLELNRCRINVMVDDPNFEKSDKKKPGQCRDGRAHCEDCRETHLTSILSSHFTICQKPWRCMDGWDGGESKLCSKLHGEWFRIRRNFEESRTDQFRNLPELSGTFKPETFQGYCVGPGPKNYVSLKI